MRETASHVQTPITEKLKSAVRFSLAVDESCDILKELSQELASVMQHVVNVVGSIIARPKASCLFKVLHERMGSKHRHLLLQMELHWLSHVKVLGRDLQDEVSIFFKQKTRSFCKKLEGWLDRVGRHSYSLFKLLSDFATSRTLPAANKETVVTYLSPLRHHSMSYLSKSAPDTSLVAPYSRCKLLQ